MQTVIDLINRNLKFFEQISGEILKTNKTGWFTPNDIIMDRPAFSLRKFSAGKDVVLIVPPQAGHNSTICDFDDRQSLIQTAIELGKCVYVIDWKSCTLDRKNETIEDLVSHLLAAANIIPQPFTLIGLCQGGWLSAIFASLFPEKIKHLVVAGAPINAKAGEGYLQTLVETFPQNFFEEIVSLGGGIMRGNLILMGWKMMHPVERTKDYIDLWLAVGTDEFWKIKKFRDWYECPQDLAGAYYLETVDKIFRKNELWEGKLNILGKPVKLENISCPITSIAGENDDITPVPQALALPGGRIVIPGVGHIGIFMSKKSQKYFREILGK